LLAFFEGFHLGETPYVTRLAGKLCGKIAVHEIECYIRPDDARPEHEDVHIVVLNALLRRVVVMAHRSAYAFEFVGGDGNTDAAAANQNAAIRLAALHLLCNQGGKIGIIVGLPRLMRPNIGDVVPALFEVFHRALLHVIAGVVGSDYNFHRDNSG